MAWQERYRYNRLMGTIHFKRGQGMKATQVWLPPELRRAAGIVAAAQNSYCSLGDVIRTSLDDWLARNAPGAKKQAVREMIEEDRAARRGVAGKGVDVDQPSP